MYAFRKPFTAGTFEEVILWGIGYKTVLIAAQLAGYTISKFVGIKIIAEMPPARRATTLLGLIALAELSLLLFAVIPPPYNFVMLFFNGLPLGMVFGLVLAYLEGRQMTEALAAGLCASFIVSSGWVRSIGRYLIQWGVSEYWMPFLTGLFFIVPLLISVWLLCQIPKPNEKDIQHRSQRTPMTKVERKAFFKRHRIGLLGLLLIYVVLTIMRTIRDDFSVELWRDLGHADKPDIFAKSETLVMFGVVGINGAACWITSNRKAFLGSLGLVVTGFLLALFTLIAQLQGLLSPFTFMVLIGLGTYIPYVAFHTTVFERLLAAFRETGNIGYVMYLADAVGYLGTIGVMACHNLAHWEVDFVTLFVRLSMLIATLAIGVTLFLIWHYQKHLPESHEPE